VIHSSSLTVTIFFGVGDAVEQQRGFHLADGAESRCAARRRPKSSLRIMSVFMPCCGKSAQAAVEAGIDLLLHQRFRNREGYFSVSAAKSFADFCSDCAAWWPADARGCGFESGEISRIAQLLGEFVVSSGRCAS
jgi:hypothetical protein